MKATELKIGDWVSYKGKPTKICSLDMYAGCGVYEVADGATDDRLDPLPLTAEILEKNGWIYNDKYDLYFRQGASHTFLKEKESGFLLYTQNLQFPVATYKSVHQLQHLLWALEIDDDLKI